jgi:hypothetical protein
MSARIARLSFLVFAIVLISMVLLPQKAFGGGGKPPKRSNISVTTYFSDLDLNNLPSTIASDGQGAYVDGIGGATSFLTANTCNSLPTGDWRFDSTNSPSRAVSESFFSQDAVQPGDPHYQAPANPPYFGSQLQKAHLNVQCTCTGKDMGSMTTGTQITCPMINGWTDAAGDDWGFSPAKSFSGHLETTDVQITCNSVGTNGLCNDWSIDPDPAEGAEAVGRLGETVPTHPGPTKIDDGDFYMRLHIHITRP